MALSLSSRGFVAAEEIPLSDKPYAMAKTGSTTL
jgi:hypothetical protein